MSNRSLWINRKFTFGFPVSDFPSIIRRLKETPVKIKDLIEGIQDTVLKSSLNGKWSIQEHIGHLAILESIFLGRLDDYESELEVLRHADMSNESTNGADYNSVDIRDITDNFTLERGKLIQRLAAYPPDIFNRVALHPRLNKPMRMVDSIYFEAEHDDHHLAAISKLLQQ
ncbi:MAG: DinB family protein [Calditrichaeota bacterium]|jgi:hypothetical protein|nr:DinB family protein [Calditrichota bacterium]MBT7617063.1 DinB family protein [Calditrichota bacterium]MBT7788200.1 DinB family protein [Calditrichota bacterium]